MRLGRLKTSAGVLPAVLLLWGCCLLAQEPEQTPASRGKEPDASAHRREARGAENYAAVVKEKLRRLYSPRYKVRQEATLALQALPPEAGPKIVEAYCDNHSPEVRKRLASAIDEDDIAHLLAKRPGSRLGYFGMSFGSVLIPGANNPRLMVTVGEVLPDSPADTCGMMPGDVILSVGDLDVTRLKGTEEFAEKIAAMTPGTQARLVVERHGQAKTLRIRVGNRLLDAPEPWKSQWRREAVREFWEKIDKRREAL
jgi:C-terminal processing protease CtpA/Prc